MKATKPKTKRVVKAKPAAPKPKVKTRSVIEPIPVSEPTPTPTLDPRSAQPPDPPKPNPLRNVVTIGLPGYRSSKFLMLGHLGGKIDSLAAPVLDEDCQRYDVRMTIEIVEARPIV